MSALRRLWQSFPVRALLILVALLLPWPSLDRTVCELTSGWLNAALGRKGTLVSLEFRLPTAEHRAGPWEVLAIARERDGARYVATAVDTRRSGYLHAATFLALAMAMNTSRRSKLLIALVGSALLLFIPLLPPLAFFSGTSLGLRVFELNTVSGWLVEIGYRALVAAPGMAYAVGGLLWLALASWLTPEIF